MKGAGLAARLIERMAKEFHSVHKMPPFSIQEFERCEHPTCVEARAALAQQTPASQIGIPARELLMKVAQSRIHTGLTGTGLRNDECTAKNKEIFMGVYGYCGKTLKEYLEYSLPAQQTPHAAGGELREQTSYLHPIDEIGARTWTSRR